MRIGIDKDGHLVLKEVYSGVLMETQEGNQIGICMRDDTFEINIIPKNGKSQWFRVNMQEVAISAMKSFVSTESDLGSCGQEDYEDE